MRERSRRASRGPQRKPKFTELKVPRSLSSSREGPVGEAWDLVLNEQLQVPRWGSPFPSRKTQKRGAAGPSPTMGGQDGGPHRYRQVVLLPTAHHSERVLMAMVSWLPLALEPLLVCPRHQSLDPIGTPPGKDSTLSATQSSILSLQGGAGPSPGHAETSRRGAGADLGPTFLCTSV